MKDLSRVCSPGVKMELDRGVHYFDSGADYYGQDDGEVSWRIPLGRVNWAYPKQIPILSSGMDSPIRAPCQLSGALGCFSGACHGRDYAACRAGYHRNRKTRADLSRRGTDLSEPRIGARRR